MKASHLTKIKILFGYSLLLGVLFIGLFFIRREMRDLSQSENQQGLATDSLLNLLNEKDQSILQMIQVMNRASEQAMSITDIEKIIAEQDSVFTQKRVQRNVIIKQDTIIAQPPRKKFFKRVANVFAPSKKDTAVIVNTSQVISVDTLIETINPADSLHQRILKANVANRRKQQALAKQNSEHFKRLNEELSARMDSLMIAYEDNIIHQANVMNVHEQAVRARATEMLTRIGIGAIVLSVMFFFIIWRDLARNNRYRKRLEDANHRAEELLETREKLMLAITHDIKAPLSSIIGFLDLLNLSVKDEKERSYIYNMECSSKHLQKLVTDLIDFHRLDLNKMEVNRDSFNPYELFEELKDSFIPLMKAKGLEFNCKIESDLDKSYVSDPLRIRQIVTNLLSNAVKFTKEGSVSLTVTYKKSKLCIHVKDTGPGMEENQKKLIFQEFTRLPQAQGEEGFGLGLSIVRKLIILLEGKIDIESAVGKGTEFIVTLPVYPVPGGASLTMASKKKASAKKDIIVPVKPLNLILIDDDQMQLTLTHEQLKRHGISSVCCNQINELLDQLRNHHFDALLTDVQMPAMNGFDLLRLLRSSNIGQSKEIPVIAVTARSDMKTEEFIEKGFSGCLHKPFSVTELLGILDVENKSVSKPVTSPKPAKKTEGKYQINALIGFMEDDKEASAAIISTFIEETKKDLTLITDALRNKDAALIAARAHKLLPLFVMMRNDEATKCLTWLEKQKDATSMTDDFVTHAKACIQILQDATKAAETYRTTL